jgi:signal transduction histidine kinase
MQTEFKSERIKRYIVVKWWVMAFSYVGVLAQNLIGTLGWTTAIPTYAGITLITANNLILQIMARRGKFNDLLTQFFMAIDIVVIGGTLYYGGGGAESPWWFLPIFLIFISGYIYDIWISLAFAAFSTVLISLVFSLEYFRLVPHFSVYSFKATFWREREYVFDYIMSMTVLYFSGAVISGLLGNLFKQHAEEITQLNASLEEKVVERARQLKETLEKLYRTEKLAAIGKLAGAIGHELRNPLGVIKNSAYFLNLKLQPAADDKIKKHLSIIEKEVGASTLIIEDILSFARIKMPEQKPVEIAPLIRESVESLPAPEGITVDIRPAEGLPSAFIDRAQILQVFINLIRNAYQAMPQGGRLTISTSLKGNFLEVAFADTGVGISPENLPKLFEPLFTTKEMGTGFGLAIVASIVEGHKGKVEVESKIGEGATFKILLPAVINPT